MGQAYEVVPRIRMDTGKHTKDTYRAEARSTVHPKPETPLC